MELLTKYDIYKALKNYGFVQDNGKRTDGSHKFFYNEEMPIVSITVVDHQNKCEVNRCTHSEVINAICLMVIIKSYYNGQLDKQSVKKHISCLDRKIQEIILNKLKKLNIKDKYALMAIIPNAVRNVLSQFISDLNNQAIIDYFLSNIKSV